MLNECLERDLCTYALENQEQFQYLRLANLKNRLSGLKRAMTTVARGFIMDCGGFEKELDLKERQQIAKSTRDFLSLWCGFLDAKKTKAFYDDCKVLNNKNIESLSKCEGWFPRYLAAIHNSLIKKFNEKTNEIVIENNAKKELLLCISEQKQYLNDLFNNFVMFTDIDTSVSGKEIQIPPSLSNTIAAYDELSDLKKAAAGVDRSFESIVLFRNKKTQFSRKLFNLGLQDTEGNDSKLICYEGIIADAFYLGPLRNKILVAFDDENEFYGIRIAGKNAQDKLSKNSKKVIMCLTAHYLLEQISNPNVSSCVLVKTDLSNWAGLDKAFFDNGKLNEYLFFDCNTGELKPVFDLQEDLVGGNTCKISINRLWLKNSGFRVVETSDIKNAVINESFVCEGRKFLVIMTDDKKTYLKR